MVYFETEIIKLLENHDKNPTKPVLSVSHLWGWQLEVQNHKLRHKEVLNYSNFICKIVQELQAFEEEPFSEELMSIADFTLPVNFAEIPDWDELLWHFFFQAIKSQCELSPHLRNPGLPDAIGAKYFSYRNHSNLQRMYTEVPLLQTQYN